MACDPSARVEHWVGSNMAAPEGAAVVEQARAMDEAAVLEFADFLDEMPW